jgi:hypothetical protein
MGFLNAAAGRGYNAGHHPFSSCLEHSCSSAFAVARSTKCVAIAHYCTHAWRSKRWNPRFYGASGHGLRTVRPEPGSNNSYGFGGNFQAVNILDSAARSACITSSTAPLVPSLPGTPPVSSFCRSAQIRWPSPVSSASCSTQSSDCSPHSIYPLLRTIGGLINFGQLPQYAL